MMLRNTNGGLGNRIRGADPSGASKQALQSKMANKIKNLETQIDAKNVT
jgi:hypothetical protein